MCSGRNSSGTSDIHVPPPCERWAEGGGRMRARALSYSNQVAASGIRYPPIGMELDGGGELHCCHAHQAACDTDQTPRRTGDRAAEGLRARDAMRRWSRDGRDGRDGPADRPSSRRPSALRVRSPTGRPAPHTHSSDPAPGTPRGRPRPGAAVARELGCLIRNGPRAPRHAPTQTTSARQVRVPASTGRAA